MKKQLIEPDFIGTQEPLTKEEETALARYFADKKSKNKQPISSKKAVNNQPTTTP